MLQTFENIICYTRFGPDSGQSAAINEGWKALNARYYGWLNDDDYLHPNALETVKDVFERGHIDVVHGRSDIFQNNHLKFGYGHLPIQDSLLRENRLAQPSTFIAKTALKAICKDDIFSPLDENSHFAMDWDLWQRLYLSGANFQHLDNSLSITRWYPQTKTASFNVRKFVEYANLIKHKSGQFRKFWTIFNMLVQNLGIYSKHPLPFKILINLLARYRKDQPTNTKEESRILMDVFHFNQTNFTVNSSINDECLKEDLNPGEIYQTTEHSVTLKPVV